MSDVDDALARAKQEWPTRGYGSATLQAFRDRAVLAEAYEELRAKQDEYDDVIGTLSAECERLTQQLDDERAEHRAYMAEAGGELSDLARELDYAERRLEDQGPVW